MNILAFDTTLDKTYIALQKGETIVGRVIETDEKNYHSAYLISAIKNILQENDLKLQELGLIAVNNGPGSFTGIRVGVTVAKTLSKELGVNVLGVSSLDILQKAYEACLCSAFDNKNSENSVQGACPESPDVILDARKETFYFKASNGAKNPTNAENAVSDDIALIPYFEIQNHITQNALVCGSSSFSKLKTILENCPEINLINFEQGSINLALTLLDIAKRTVQNSANTDFSWHTLNPRYIQPPPIHKK